MRKSWRIVLTTTFAILVALLAAALSPQAQAIETTYGEDPVPDTHYNFGPLKLGYGVDPIPAKTLRERWYDWHRNIPDNSPTVQTYPPVRPRPKNYVPDHWQPPRTQRAAAKPVPSQAVARPSSRRTAKQAVDRQSR